MRKIIFRAHINFGQLQMEFFIGSNLRLNFLETFSNFNWQSRGVLLSGNIFSLKTIILGVNFQLKSEQKIAFVIIANNKKKIKIQHSIPSPVINVRFSFNVFPRAKCWKHFWTFWLSWFRMMFNISYDVDCRCRWNINDLKIHCKWIDFWDHRTNSHYFV